MLATYLLWASLAGSSLASGIQAKPSTVQAKPSGPPKPSSINAKRQVVSGSCAAPSLAVCCQRELVYEEKDEFYKYTCTCTRTHQVDITLTRPVNTGKHATKGLLGLQFSCPSGSDTLCCTLSLEGRSVCIPHSPHKLFRLTV